MSISDEHLDLLKKGILMITSVPEEELNKLQDIFFSKTLSRDEYFLREGELPKQIGFIISGVVRFYYTTDKGEDFIKSFATEETFITSYSAILRNKASTFFIQALEETTLLVTNYIDFVQVTKRHPSWQVMVNRILETLYLKKEKRENQFLSDDAQTRYEKFKIEFPNLKNRVHQYHIASYLGITNVSLSRLRKKNKN